MDATTNVQQGQPSFGTRFGNRATEAVKKVRGDNLLLVILAGIFIFVLVYLIVLYNRPSLLNYTLSPTPIKLDDEDIKEMPNTDKLPSLSNGREYAYSFWLYLETVKTNDNYNLVFLRSPNTETNHLQSANPIVYLDKNSNKMIVKVRTTKADTLTFNNLDEKVKTFASVANKRRPQYNDTCQQVSDYHFAVGNSGNNTMTREEANRITTSVDPASKDTCSLGPNPDETIHQDNCNYATFIIDYVPLQRWVNIIINVNNNMLALIMDGAIHSTRVLNQDNSLCEDNSSSNLVSPTTGSVMIGNINEENNLMPAADGFISKLQFFNYSLSTPQHIQKIYNAGPVDSVGILKKLGLPLYGFRNPLYRIDAVKNE